MLHSFKSDINYEFKATGGIVSPGDCVTLSIINLAYHGLASNHKFKRRPATRPLVVRKPYRDWFLRTAHGT
jgi:hypothetical protein